MAVKIIIIMNLTELRDHLLQIPLFSNAMATILIVTIIFIIVARSTISHTPNGEGTAHWTSQIDTAYCIPSYQS